MKVRVAFIYCLTYLFMVAIAGCKKDTLTAEEKAVTVFNVYDDAEMRLPIEVVAGKGTLLSAYFTLNTSAYRFMLTDNNGKHLWTKEFGLTGLSSMLAEEDGTFTIFENQRLINIDVNGNIVKDIPDFLTGINGYVHVHVMLNKSGNYFIYGGTNSLFNWYAFAFEITHSGDMVFKKVYTANTMFTGCQLTSDGGYLFLGNFFANSGSFPTRFFICKMDSTGNVTWIKNHVPPDLGIDKGNNIFYTHDIIESNDGNYICFVGSTNIDDNNFARIYKISPDGNLLDSTDINFAPRNIFAGRNMFELSISAYPFINGYCSVKKADGTYVVYLNNRKFESQTQFTTVANGNQAFALRFSDDLSVQHSGYLQSSYSDYFASVCETSDGKIAAFGLISSFGGNNKPILLISE